MADAPFDLPKAHRWFAVEFNNQAWDLVEKPARSAEETRRMIAAAHAAALHWSAVGAPINDLRAAVLLATAHAAAGDVPAAVRHARRTLDILPGTADTTAFDQATAWGCAALALHLAGQRDEALRCHLHAKQAAETLTDTADRGVFEKLYPAPK